MGSAVGGPLVHPVGLCGLELATGTQRDAGSSDPQLERLTNLGLVQYYLGRTWGLKGGGGAQRLVCGFGFCLLADASPTVITVGGNFGHLPTTNLSTLYLLACPSARLPNLD